MTKRDELIEEGQLKYRQMVYKLFEQNETGKELLKTWVTSYIFRPVCIENQPVESAKRDGENRFIRSILTAIEELKLKNQEEANK